MPEEWYILMDTLFTLGEAARGGNAWACWASDVWYDNQDDAELQRDLMRAWDQRN